MSWTPKELDQFAALARDFCVWCESPVPGEDLHRHAAVWLSRLHASALELPAASPQNAFGLIDLPSDDVGHAKRKFDPLMGDLYRVVDAIAPSADDPPSIGDLGDDMLDTYMELKRGLAHYNSGRRELCLWHWSYMHGVHWGDHAVKAIAALQGLHLSTSSEHTA